MPGSKEYFAHKSAYIEQPCQIGWMSRHGIRLPEPDADRIMICPESGYTYKEIEPDVVRCLDWDEESALPPDKAIGKISYDQLKKK